MDRPLVLAVPDGLKALALGVASALGLFGLAAWYFLPIQIDARRESEFTYELPSFHHGDQSPLAFDSQRWREARTEAGLNARYRMLPDLFDDDELVGLDADRIEELLGPLEWGVEQGEGFAYLFPVADPWGRPDDLVVEFDADCTVLGAHLNSRRRAWREARRGPETGGSTRRRFYA